MAQSKEVKQRLDFLIKELGFKKKKGSYVFSPDGSKVFSLDVCGMHGTHGVYPVGIHVGVAIREVNDIIIQLTECGDHPLVSNDMFIIGTDLGYLTPLKKYHEWLFVENENNESVYNDIIFNIKNYAFPFFYSKTTFEGLFDSIKNNSPWMFEYNRYEYLPIMYYMSGDWTTGKQTIQKFIHERNNDGNDDSPDFKRYMVFVNNYEKLRDVEPPALLP